MSKITSLPWRKFVKRLRKVGFDGPYAGGKHHYMIKGEVVLTIPNPHRRDIGPALISRILRQSGISRKEWRS